MPTFIPFMLCLLFYTEGRTNSPPWNEYARLLFPRYSYLVLNSGKMKHQPNGSGQIPSISSPLIFPSPHLHLTVYSFNIVIFQYDFCNVHKGSSEKNQICPLHPQEPSFLNPFRAFRPCNRQAPCHHRCFPRHASLERKVFWGVKKLV